VKKAFDLYYDFDYDLGVRDMQDIEAYLKKIPECSGKVGAVGYCLGRQAVLPDVLPHRHRLRGGVLRNVYRAPHPRGEESAPALHAAHGDEGPLGAGRGERLIERRLSPNPMVTIHKYPGADHAFARHGGKTWSKPEADRALALSIDFFRTHLGR